MWVFRGHQKPFTNGFHGKNLARFLVADCLDLETSGIRQKREDRSRTTLGEKPRNSVRNSVCTHDNYLAKSSSANDANVLEMGQVDSLQIPLRLSRTAGAVAATHSSIVCMAHRLEGKTQTQLQPALLLCPCPCLSTRVHEPRQTRGVWSGASYLCGQPGSECA